jgi:hypothetical protein
MFVEIRNENGFILDFKFYLKQDIYDFLVKNLDLDSNLYNLKKLIKKAK